MFIIRGKTVGSIVLFIFHQIGLGNSDLLSSYRNYKFMCSDKLIKGSFLELQVLIQNYIHMQGLL